MPRVSEAHLFKRGERKGNSRLFLARGGAGIVILKKKRSARLKRAQMIRWKLCDNELIWYCYCACKTNEPVMLDHFFKAGKNILRLLAQSGFLLKRKPKMFSPAPVHESSAAQILLIFANFWLGVSLYENFGNLSHF